MSEILELERAAEAFRDAGSNEQAIEKYEAILAIDEKFVRAHLALALLYLRVENADKAVAHGEQAVKLEPGDDFNMVALSRTYQQAFELTRDPKFIEMAENAARLN